MNFKQFTSKLPPSVIKRAFVLYFLFFDFSYRYWYKELNENILKFVDCLG
jgi:hypothetical protein